MVVFMFKVKPRPDRSKQWPTLCQCKFILNAITLCQSDQVFLLLQILLRHSRQHHQHHATLNNIAILQYCCQKVKYRCRGLNILAIGKQRILLSVTLHVKDGVGYYIAILIILYNIVNILQEMLLCLLLGAVLYCSVAMWI